jgi:hypothetical protein
VSEWITAAIFVVGAIYAAGRVLSNNKAEIDQAKIDLNRMGQKIRDEERAALRRHFNSSLLQVACENDRKTRFKIAGQLKED